MTDEVHRYKLRKFTPERLDEVAAEWQTHAGQEEFESEMGTLFEWCRGHLEHREGDGHALELYNVTLGKTDAILDVIQGKWGTMTKMLKLYLSPEYWPLDRITDSIVKVHAGAYAKFIFDGMDKGVNEIKIYGRNDDMKLMLESLERVWPQYNTGSSATMQGRWLTITPS